MQSWQCCRQWTFFAVLSAFPALVIRRARASYSALEFLISRDLDLAFVDFLGPYNGRRFF